MKLKQVGRFIIIVFVMFIALFAGLNLGVGSVSAKSWQPFKPLTIQEALPEGLGQDEPYTPTTGVGTFVTGTVYCNEFGEDQDHYLVSSRGREKVGIPSGPFQYWSSFFLNRPLWMYGVQARVCGVMQFWAFWWAEVQSEEKPFPAGEPQTVSGRLDFQEGRLPEFVLRNCDASPTTPWMIALITEHDPALMDQLRKLGDGQPVTLSVLLADGTYSRGDGSESVKTLWVLELVDTHGCDPATDTPVPTSTATMTPEASSTPPRHKIFLPFAAGWVLLRQATPDLAHPTATLNHRLTDTPEAEATQPIPRSTVTPGPTPRFAAILP